MNKIDIDRTAQIAFLKLNDEEKQSFQESIEKNIESAEKLFVNLTCEPTTKITTKIYYREDSVVPSADRDELLRNAKENSNGAFVVPKIVE